MNESRGCYALCLLKYVGQSQIFNHLYVESEKVNEKNNKKKQTSNLENKLVATSGRESVDEEQDWGRKLRGSDYVLSV